MNTPTPTPRPPSTSTSADAADTLVLGAGPYGLSAYAHLQRLGVRTRILGDPMSTWRSHMPAGMLLKSTPAASNIAAGRPGYALADYCAQQGTRPPTGHEQVPVELFNAYGMWFADTLAPQVERTEVTEIDQDHDGRFHIATTTGERFTVRSVVIASGLIEHAYTPPELAPLLSEPTAPLSHSADHTDLSALAGKHVAVIGAGQSALEIAALLAESGAFPTLLTKGQKLLFADSPHTPTPSTAGALSRLPKPDGPLGPGWSLTAVTKGPAAFRHLPDAARLKAVARILGPSGGWWLRERVQTAVPIRFGQKVLGATADADGITLKLASTDGQDGTLHADHVISATGYRIRPDSFAFLSDPLRARLDRVASWPRLGPGYQSNIPGLFFIGFPSAASYGPLMRFVCGTTYAAPRLAKAIASRHPAR